MHLKGYLGQNGSLKISPDEWIGEEIKFPLLYLLFPAMSTDKLDKNE